MARFIYIYRGEARELTPEQGAERMAAFTAWIERVGAALVDAGSPFGTSVAVRGDGSETPASASIGYSIVEAEDLAAARVLTDGLPLQQDDDVNAAVEIFELLAM